MKRAVAHLSIAILILLTSHSHKAIARSGRFVLPKGILIKIKLLEAVSSAYSKKGDPVYFEVIEPVYVENQLAIQGGLVFQGKVTQVVDRKENKIGVDVVKIFIETVPSVDGGLVPVNREFFAEGLGSGGILWKSEEAHFLCGEEFHLRTPVSHVIESQPILSSYVESRLPAYASDKIYDAEVKTRMLFNYEREQKLRPVEIRLDSKFDWKHLRLVAVDKNILPAPLKPVKVKGTKKGRFFYFDGWNVAKHLPKATYGGKHFLLEFAGDSGGKTFKVKALLNAGRKL